MKVYKVTQRIGGGKYVSCIVYNYPHAVEYKVGQWAMATIEGSRLFAFDNIEDARKFSKLMGYAIFEAKALDVVPLTKVLVLPTKQALALFWQKILRVPLEGGPVLSLLNYDDAYLYTRHAPIGTVGCAAIKLVRKVSV